GGSKAGATRKILAGGSVGAHRWWWGWRDARRDPRRSADLTVDGAVHHGDPPLRPPTSRARPVPTFPRPPDRRRPARARDRRALLAPGARVGADREGPSRRRRHPDGLGQDALLQPPRPPVLAAPARRARPLSLPDEGARPGPARGARGVGEEPARDADVHLRRRHAPRRAACRPRAGESRADEPRHAPLGDPPAPYEMGDALPESSLCRHRRAP